MEEEEEETVSRTVERGIEEMHTRCTFSVKRTQEVVITNRHKLVEDCKLLTVT